jgi:hypothetical protein
MTDIENNLRKVLRLIKASGFSKENPNYSDEELRLLIDILKILKPIAGESDD